MNLEYICTVTYTVHSQSAVTTIDADFVQTVHIHGVERFADARAGAR